VVDVKSVVEYAKTLPNVVYAEENLYSCSQDTQEKIKELIKEHNLNRVVVASCSPRTHEPLFQETIQEAGYLFELANIRDQCSWVHMNEKEGATEKSKDLVRMAVARSGLTESLKRLTLDLNPSALVVGGGIAGMVSGLNIADQGFKVYLIEKEAEHDLSTLPWKGTGYRISSKHLLTGYKNTPKLPCIVMPSLRTCRASWAIIPQPLPLKEKRSL